MTIETHTAHYSLLQAQYPENLLQLAQILMPNRKHHRQNISGIYRIGTSILSLSSIDGSVALRALLRLRQSSGSAALHAQIVPTLRIL